MNEAQRDKQPAPKIVFPKTRQDLHILLHQARAEEARGQRAARDDDLRNNTKIITAIIRRRQREQRQQLINELSNCTPVKMMSIIDEFIDGRDAYINSAATPISLGEKTYRESANPLNR